MNSSPLMLQGKTVLITGGTSGIGAAAALELALMGARTYVVGRSRERCESTVRHIKRVGGNPDVEYFRADLSSQTEIRRLADDFKRKSGTLDVLVNNAGAVFAKRGLSADGLEMTFALNHLGYFLLTVLLLDRLKAGPSGRIIVVSSHAHENATMDFDDLQCEHHYERLKAYAQSKLANLLFTYELARRLQETSITVNALTPGAVATRLGSNNGWLKAKVRNLVYRANGSMVSPERGASTIVHLASASKVEGATGGYYRDSKVSNSSDASRNIGDARRLWDVSEQLTGVTSVLLGIPASDGVLPHP